MLEAGFVLSSVRAHQVAMGKTVSGVISHDGVPFARNVRLVLQPELDNAVPLKDMAMPVAVFAIGRQVNDVRCFVYWIVPRLYHF